MEEQRLEQIWRDNLRKFNGNIRLDSIIVRAMNEACEEAIKNHGVSHHVSKRCTSFAPLSSNNTKLWHVDRDWETSLMFPLNFLR